MKSQSLLKCVTATLESNYSKSVSKNRGRTLIWRSTDIIPVKFCDNWPQTSGGNSFQCLWLMWVIHTRPPRSICVQRKWCQTPAHCRHTPPQGLEVPPSGSPAQWRSHSDLPPELDTQQGLPARDLTHTQTETSGFISHLQHSAAKVTHTLQQGCPNYGKL